MAKCNCGRPARYIRMNSDGVETVTCNKHMVCPTYNELVDANKELTKKLSEFYKIRDSLNGLQNNIKNVIEVVDKI